MIMDLRIWNDDDDDDDGGYNDDDDDDNNYNNNTRNVKTSYLQALQKTEK